jgi:histone acetyltransferase (RNA polymerase elongator complex component)
MGKEHYIIPFFIPHVGCPHGCVFCNQKRITGTGDMVQPSEVLPTIRRYRSTYRGKPRRIEAAFFGGSFTGIPVKLQESYLENARAAVKQRLIDGIRLSTRPDYIDQSTLDRLKGYGVDTIELGVQSMDDKVLIKSGRGHSSDHVRDAAMLIKDNGFKLGLQMMIGLPGDSADSDRYTAIEICRLKPSFVRIYPTLVVRDTPLEQMYRSGRYKPLELDEAVGICSEITEMFIKSGIDVIRIGLQTTDMINVGRDVVAGPFHPAFRQLVDAALIRSVIERVLRYKAKPGGGFLLMEANPSIISCLVGVRKESITRLAIAYPGIRIKARPNQHVDNHCIRFLYNESVFEVDYIQMIINR